MLSHILHRVRRKNSNGFTIVELLIVVVVIAILAAIVTVAYTGISSRAVESSMKSDLQNTATKIAMYNSQNGVYPDSSVVEKVESNGNTISYNKKSQTAYCMTIVSTRTSKKLYATQDGSVQEGSCPFEWNSVYAGNNTSCGIASTNQTYCWGSGMLGALGDGDSSIHNSLVPKAVVSGAMPGGVYFKEIGVSSQTSCGLASDGWVYCWGANSRGILGNGSMTSSTTSPAPIQRGAIPTGVTILKLATGTYHVCALASNGSVYCWGAGTNGELGNGASADSSTPVLVSAGTIPGGSTVRLISSGNGFTCVVPSNEETYCWGFNFSTNGTSATPALMTRGALPAGAIGQLGTGNMSLCVTSVSTQRIYCLGDNGYGNLGDGSTTNRTSFVLVSLGVIPSGLNVTKLAVGSLHVCAVMSNTSTYCWGGGSMGALGNGSVASSYTPISVLQGSLPTGESFQTLSTGTFTSCGISSIQQLYCWGSNGTGTVGDGTSTNRSVPTKTLDP